MSELHKYYSCLVRWKFKLSSGYRVFCVRWPEVISSTTQFHFYPSHKAFISLASETRFLNCSVSGTYYIFLLRKISVSTCNLFISVGKRIFKLIKSFVSFMKDQSSNKVVLSEEDFRLLSALTENVSAQGHKQEGTLTYEIARATVLPESKMPSDVVRLGARVKVKDVDSNREMQFSIV